MPADDGSLHRSAPQIEIDSSVRVRVQIEQFAKIISFARVRCISIRAERERLRRATDGGATISQSASSRNQNNSIKTRIRCAQEITINSIQCSLCRVVPFRPFLLFVCRIKFASDANPKIPSQSSSLPSIQFNLRFFFLGCSDTLYRLSFELERLEKAVWEASASHVETCQNKGPSENDCRNYIKVLESNGNQLYACGTHAFSPHCSWRQVSTLPLAQPVVSLNQFRCIGRWTT